MRGLVVSARQAALASKMAEEKWRVDDQLRVVDVEGGVMATTFDLDVMCWYFGIEEDATTAAPPSSRCEALLRLHA
jgi:hypothetical protein